MDSLSAVSSKSSAFSLSSSLLQASTQPSPERDMLSPWTSRGGRMTTPGGERYQKTVCLSSRRSTRSSNQFPSTSSSSSPPAGHLIPTDRPIANKLISIADVNLLLILLLTCDRFYLLLLFLLSPLLLSALNQCDKCANFDRWKAKKKKKNHGKAILRCDAF